VRIRHRTLLRQLSLDSELLDRYFAELLGLLSGIRRRGRLLSGERDLVLSHGERMSARIVARALGDAGVQATPVDAFDLGLTTDSMHGAARPLRACAAAIRAALEQVPGVPVVTGFLAQDRHGNLTTLGRNGSDLTAAIVAESVGASGLELWKAVGGVMTADPAIVSEARVIERLGFEEAAELAFHGADVLHPAALAPALRGGVEVRILDVRHPAAPGTRIEAGVRADVPAGEQAHDQAGNPVGNRFEDPAGGPVGIAARRRLVSIGLEVGDETRATRMAELSSALARHGVEPALWSGSAERVDVLVVPGPAADPLLAEIGRRAVVEKDLALAAVVGRAGRIDEPGGEPLPQRALALLGAARIEVLRSLAGTRQPSQVFVIPATEIERAVRVLHAGLFRAQGACVP